MDSTAPTVIDRKPPLVLVADDDVAIRRLLVRVLSRWGYLVTTAASVEETVRLMASYCPNILVLDLHLGSGNGTEVLARLPEPKPLVLVCTGDDQHVSGVDGFVRKPFSVVEVVRAIHALAKRIER